MEVWGGCAVSMACLVGLLASGSDAYLVEVARPGSNTDPCSTQCLDVVASTTQHVGSLASCARGCRLYDIAQLIYSGNSTLAGCLTYCGESYKESAADLLSCKTGCSSSKPRLPIEVPLVAEISWSFFIESGDSDQEETLMEPSYRDQLSSLQDFRLPDMKVRSLPIKGERWAVPHCLVASLLLLLVILALLIGLLIDESSDTLRHQHRHQLADDQAPPLEHKMPVA